MKFGLIGTNWGRTYLRIINGMNEHKVTHIATSKSQPIEYAGNSLQINDWKKVVKSNCDAIIIATPTSTHKEILEYCIDEGKPTIVEKPMCIYYNDAKKIHDRAIAKNVPILVNHIHLWNPRHELLKKIIEQDDFKIKFAYSEGGNWGPFRTDTPSTYDWLPHDFSLLIDTLGSIKSLERNFGGEFNDIISISTKHNNNTKGWIYSGRMLPEKRRTFYVYDGNEKIKWDDSAPYITYGKELIPITDETPMENMINCFINAVDKNIKDRRMGVELAVEITKNIEDVHVRN